MSTYPQGKFLNVAFMWKGTVKITEMEPIFNQATDWVRYNENSWIVWTTLSAQDWYSRIAPNMTTQDRLFICELNTANKQGWLEQWIWDWLNKSRTPPPWGT